MEAATWTLIALLAATVFGGLFYLGARIDSLGAKVDAQGADLGRRIDGLGARLEGRMDGQSARIDALISQVSEHIAHHSG